MKTRFYLMSLLWLSSYFPSTAQYQLDNESQLLFESQVESVDHLSYAPANLQIFLQEHSYERWQFYFFSPDQLKQATKIALAIRELMIEQNSTFSYHVYNTEEGHKTPFFLVVSSARSLEDYNLQLAGLEKDLGPRFVTLYNQLLALCDRVKWDHQSRQPQSKMHLIVEKN